MNVKLSKFAGKRAFGVELELGNKVPLMQLKPMVEAAGSGRQVLVSSTYVQDNNNPHWHIKLDRSCGDVVGQYGCEIASYKAEDGVKDILHMARMVERVRDGGANVNERCGLHVHVETRDFTWRQMAAFVANWIKMEPHICHMIPQHRSDNKYCKFRRNESWVKDFVRAQPYGMTAEQFWERVRPINFDDKDRRKALNLCNYANAYSGRKTVEFRFPDANLDPWDIKNWVRFLVHIVEIGRKSEFPADLSIFDFRGFLGNCGLYGDQPFLILSPGLRETKLWLLRRVIKYSRSDEFCQRAKECLAFMTIAKDKPEQPETLDAATT